MGPLQGIRVIEIGGIGPGPFAGMLLADMGAEVVVVERKAIPGLKLPDCSRRGKKSIALNLKSKEGIQILLKMIDQADIIFEGFRPGVMEKLGLGPDECLKRNPKIIYGRMTGWGQTGPLAHAAGHDINYISLSGALYAMGRKSEKPSPPLNLVGDYGGGSMFLVMGILAALHEKAQSGKGQVIDAAMTEGSANLMAMFNSLHAMGMWKNERGANLLDTGAHFYDTYETKDNKYVSIGSIEPQFYALLIDKAELDANTFSGQNDQSKWPELKDKLADIFRSKTRTEWCEILEGTDVCFAPVLDFIEAQQHPHMIAREAYIDVEGMIQPAPAPRFSRTPSEVTRGAPAPGQDHDDILRDWGITL